MVRIRSIAIPRLSQGDTTDDCNVYFVQLHKYSCVPQSGNLRASYSKFHIDWRELTKAERFYWVVERWRHQPYEPDNLQRRIAHSMRSSQLILAIAGQHLLFFSEHMTTRRCLTTFQI
ncbi:hypothetical protein SCLCIDRAFT_495203 [Scleroderma citrinum Foug A]|uniref:Uncharacterized protein n=1 Tax=Scleroderma citrinum Foug A TaxID=1036808 RepID=A0A0C3EB54_9AGAM|nr:hypothetical protein SCLCIDRAFT_495203 [Scleroderma citrinum Foug A]